jgi:catechol 2,3-dioxygenase-like lactoylglutathione lyase family enzyme
MECPFTIEQLDHIVLHVRDLEKSVAFYSLLVGPIDAHPGRSALVPLGPTQRLVLFLDPDYVPPARGNLDHFDLLLKGPRDIDEVLEYMRAHGAEPVDAPEENRGGEFVQFRVLDPDGNQVELRMRK